MKYHKLKSNLKQISKEINNNNNYTPFIADNYITIKRL